MMTLQIMPVTIRPVWPELELLPPLLLAEPLSPSSLHNHTWTQLCNIPSS